MNRRLFCLSFYKKYFLRIAIRIILIYKEIGEYINSGCAAVGYKPGHISAENRAEGGNGAENAEYKQPDLSGIAFNNN